MIQIDDKFKVRWVGHDECYKDRLYLVTSFLEGCTCGKSAYITGKPELPRRPHLHVRAKLIDAPVKYMIGEGGFVFGPLDPETLHDIDVPDESWIEIVRQKGDQLNLF